MKTFLLSVSLALLLATVACGGNSSDPAGGSTAPPNAGASGASASSSKVVPHEKLAELVPNIPGFKKETDVTGTTDTGENVSRVQLNYIQDGGGTAGLSLEMMDVAGNSVMLAPLKEQLKIQGTRTSAAGTEKATTVAGFPAFEEWTPEAGNGVVSVLVSDRFVVTLTGTSVGKVDVIYKAFESIDLKKIAALK